MKWYEMKMKIVFYSKKERRKKSVELQNTQKKKAKRYNNGLGFSVWANIISSLKLEKRTKAETKQK